MCTVSGDQMLTESTTHQIDNMLVCHCVTASHYGSAALFHEEWNPVVNLYCFSGWHVFNCFTWKKIINFLKFQGLIFGFINYFRGSHVVFVLFQRADYVTLLLYYKCWNLLLCTVSRADMLVLTDTFKLVVVLVGTGFKGLTCVVFVLFQWLTC